ncbi:MAG: glutamyl-tRNA reductase [Phycisphaerae bacterium]
MRIVCVGTSHKTAGLELREKLYIDPAELPDVLTELRRTWAAAEFCVLSTCNRTEVYTARPVHGHPREQQLRQWLTRRAHLPAADTEEVLKTRVDADAAAHLFSVAAGLESLVPGEDQIVAQVKNAYAVADQVGVTGPGLHELFQTALHVAKRVRTETAVSEGKVSVASVAIDAMADSLGSLNGRTVLSVGAGKMTDLMLQQLAELGPRELIVLNRTPGKARQLADRCSGTPGRLAALQMHLPHADAVITCTASAQPVLSARAVAEAMKTRRHRPLLIIDIALPRDVEPGAGDLPGVTLINIDDLQRTVRKTLKARSDQQPLAEELIRLHVKKLTEQMNIRGVTPTIRALYRRMQSVADEQLDEALRKLSTHEDVEEDARILRRALHRTIRRILHPAAVNLREAAGSDTVRAHIAALNELFELDDWRERPPQKKREQ